MKLLRIKTSNFKNCEKDTVIDLVAKSKKTSEDKEYELQEIAEDLYIYSVGAFIGKNASGKTTALEILDCCYDILGTFTLENKHYSYDDIELEMIFYHEGFLYRYTTILKEDPTSMNKAVFVNQHLYKKQYFKTKINSIYDLSEYKEITNLTQLPEDTSIVFFILKKKQVQSVFFNSEDMGIHTYQRVFMLLKMYSISDTILTSIVRIFDNNIHSIEMIDEHNYRVDICGNVRILSDKELLYILSSGTTKGLLLYTLAVASLKTGFTLLIDEAETHFHKTLVENLLSLYMDKNVNKHNASLLFSTHYCEVLDLLNRHDNIWVCQSNEKVMIKNMYEYFNIRSGILKSKCFYNNTFQTAVNYEDLMDLKRNLMR